MAGGRVSRADEIIAAEQRIWRENFINNHGIITIRPDNSDQGNGLLQTGLWFCIKASGGPLKAVYCDALQGIINKCHHVNWPMLWRSPLKKNADDDQKQDDYYGALAACYHAGLDFAVQFYTYGEHRGWFIDIQHAEAKRIEYFFARFLGFRPFAKACARATAPEIRLTWWDHAELTASIMWDAFFSVKKSDACMRTFCLISVARKESPLAGLAARFWLSRVRARYGITGLAFEGYFQSKTHPLVMGDWE